MAAACCSLSKLFQQQRDFGDGSITDERSGVSALRFNALPAFPQLCKERKGFAVCSTAQLDSVVTAKTGVSGLSRCCQVSVELQRIVGAAELPRHFVVKLVWKYIHDNNLQDPNNKRIILCNPELAEVLGVEKTDMLQLSKLLSKHLSYDGPTRPRAPKSSAADKAAGIARPLRTSEALRNFLGTDEKLMVRSDVVKSLWDYIKKNDLQDPSDRRKVICDSKLRNLLQCDSLLGISITKYLTPHLLKD